MEGVGESGVGGIPGEGQEVAALRQREPWLHEDFRCPRERRGNDLLGPHGPWCFPALVGGEGTASGVAEVEWNASGVVEVALATRRRWADIADEANEDEANEVGS